MFLMRHMRQHRQARQHDAGLTMVDVLVSIVLLSFLGSVTLAAIIWASKATSVATSRSTQIAEVSRAADRVTYDMMLADPIGYADATVVQADISRVTGQCRRVRYAIENDPGHNGKKRIATYTQRFTSACDALIAAPVTGSPNVIADNLNAAEFTFKDVSGTAIASPALPADVAYVSVSITAAPENTRGNPVTVSSGTELRNR